MPALSPAQQALAARHLRLAYALANKFASIAPHDFAEVESTATLGLVKAAATYDPTKGRFSTYAGRCITNELLALAQRLRVRYRREVYLDAPACTNAQGDTITWADRLTAPPGWEDAIEARCVVERLLPTLPTETQALLRLRYRSDRTVPFRALGPRFGVSGPVLQRHERRAFERVRRRWGVNACAS